MTKTDNNIIAKNIIELLNKGYCLGLLGAYDLYAIESGIRFKIKGSKAYNLIRITLNTKDLYDIESIKFKGIEIMNTTNVNDLFYDMVHKNIKEHTGLETIL